MTPVGGRPLEDEELLELAVAGDVGAYELLVQRYQSLAFRVAFLITRSEADAEDAAQEGFVKAYYALRTFRRSSRFRPWLLTIVSNEARKHYYRGVGIGSASSPLLRARREWTGVLK